MGRGAWLGLSAWTLLCGCGERGAIARPDAAVSADVPVIAADAPPDVPPLPDTCPPGWVRLPDRNCAPPALACDPDAGIADPTCLPGGLRSAALTPWACPAGWRQDAERGCVPTLRTDCPEGSGPLPDGTCTDTVACPEGPYPEIPAGADPSRVIYVDDDAPEGGDGSRARPLRDLGAAIERADPAGAVLVGAGSYEVAVTIPGRRVVRGVCPSRVMIRATPGGVSAPAAQGAGIALLDPSASLDLSGVTIDGRDTHLLLMRDGVTHFHHAVARGVGGDVLTLFGGRMQVDDVAIQSVRTGGHTTLVYADRGEIEMRRVSARGPTALYQSDDSTGVIEDCAAEFQGIFVRMRGNLRLARLAMRSERQALTVSNDVRVEAEDLSLAGSLEVRAGAHFTGRRVRVEDGGVVAIDQGTIVEITDLVTRYNGDTPRDGADCISSSWGARVIARRARLGPCWQAGVFAYLVGEAELEDAYVHDPRPGASGEVGVGATAALGASVSLRRTVIERAALAGVASIHLNQTLLRRLPFPMWLPMYGAQLQQQASRVALSDVVVRDSRNVPGQPSFAIAAGANSVTTGERVAVFGQDGAGILAMDSGFDRTAFVDGVARELRLDASARGLLTALLPPTIDGPSSMTLTDVYVGRVRRASILYDPMTRRTQSGSETAYGAFVSPGCTLSITNGYFDGGSTTQTALASLGELTLRGGVVTGSSRCAATRGVTTAGAVTLDGVRVQGNGRDEVCVDDAIPALRLPMSPN